MKRNNKNYIIVLVLLLIVVISIGYAVLNTTLNITGKSSISKNTWDVHFDNIKVTTGSVEAVKVPTIENNTTVDFETQLNLPGDYYEFTVDVVNNGTIDAMIESITKEPELSTEQQKYLNYTIEYQNGEQITTKQLVNQNSFVRLKVRVELRKDIDASDLPEVGDVLYLGFTVNYVQADENGISVKDDGVSNSGVKPVASGDINEIGTIVTIGDQQFYTIGTEGDNVKLLSMYNLYVGGEYNEDTVVWTAYGSEATGKQDSTMLGLVSRQTVRKGTTIFSSDTQKGTNYSDYNGSIVEGYVNAYKDILEGEEYGVPVVEARLIYKDELTDSETFACEEFVFCSDRYPWIYSTTYWSGSAISTRDVWHVDNYRGFDNLSYNNVYESGVRPVIIISKSLF